MPSPFDEIDAAVQSALDDVYGEGIRITPMAGDPNYGGHPDNSRDQRTTRATVARAPKVSSANFPSTNRKSTEAVAGTTEAWLDRAAVAALGYLPKRGDVVETLDAEDEPIESFTVSAALPGDNGDVQLSLISRGSDE